VNSPAAAFCGIDQRREAVGASGRLCGLDEVEVLADGVTLMARLFGHPPATLTAQHVRIEGGDRIRDIQVLSARLVTEDDDTCLRVVVDRRGDFSTYCLCLVEPEDDVTTHCGHDPLPPDTLAPRVPDGVDPRYACVQFGFRIDCPSDLDCKPQPCPPQPQRPSRIIDYLARDFPSFRALLLDRLATTMPQWRERHVPDLCLTLVELLAYKADQLSYQLDAVATEAYLATARRRISVRRHARLVDYRLHEGCNARAWITLQSDTNTELDLLDIVFACPPADTTVAAAGTIDWLTLQQAVGAMVYEPIRLPGTYLDELDADGPGGSLRATKPVVKVRAAHSVIHFYTWRLKQCCLPQGSTRATLLDQLEPGPAGGDRLLHLVAGNFLILEEICGAATGSRADADRRKRHVVRLVRVEPIQDPLDQTLLLEVEWDRRDALPFALCLSAQAAPPDCRFIEVAVAHGNILLVDHGTRIEECNEDWLVDILQTTSACKCDGTAADVVSLPAPLRFALAKGQLTHSVLPVIGTPPTAQLCSQDPRQAVPQAWLDLAIPDPRDPSQRQWPGTYAWTPVPDLLSSAGSAPVFVAEVDDDGITHIRFGDGAAGVRPQPGWRFRARYRVGNGQRGNVGADTIIWMAHRSGSGSGASLEPRNPLAACGGADPEPVADARLFAPHAYGRILERAVRAEDYAQIATADPRIEGANATLTWTGAWYEATVALDPYAAAESDRDLATDTLQRLQGVSRIGHDVRIVPARRVPLSIALDLCVARGFPQDDVVRAALDVLSDRALPSGGLGLFHADRLVFGEDIAASHIIAAVQCLPGVLHVELTAFARADADADFAKKSLADGLVRIASDEIPQLDNDADFPERGTLKLTPRAAR
jgi:hypothetical protein